jgi:SAM-dependent methyltransferase
MDIRDYNRKAWDRQVDSGNEWTIPASPEAIASARRGEWQVVLTPTRPVPRDWFGELSGARVLCLASGGGQQGPILAAAGARVVVLDNSPRQLDQDRLVAERDRASNPEGDPGGDRLDLTTVEGDMRDLAAFGDGSFDLVFHPVANLFIPDIRPVWRESFRVLRPGGRLLSGFVNPLQYIFDWERSEKGELVVRHAIPYSDLTSLGEEERRRWIDAGQPLEFGHTLEDQVSGQLEAGFVLTGFYEDVDPKHVLSRYIPSFIATLAVRPDGA